MDINQRNRNQIPWDEETWNRIDRAVHDECKKTKPTSDLINFF